MSDYRDSPEYLEDLLADDADRRAEHHLMFEYEHSEQGSYWAWASRMARELSP